MSSSEFESQMQCLLFRHRARSPVAQEERLAASPNQRRYPHNGKSGHCWCLSSSPSWSVGLSIQGEATDAARFAPQGALYHADVIHLLG